jgi:plastocyanin
MRLIVFVAALFVLAVIGILKIVGINKTLSENTFQQSFSDQPQVMNIEIDFSSQVIQPQELLVNHGDQVIFKNIDTASRNIIGQGWDSGPITPGGSFAKIFDHPGNFDYKISSSNLVGKITVK